MQTQIMKRVIDRIPAESLKLVGQILQRAAAKRAQAAQCSAAISATYEHEQR